MEELTIEKLKLYREAFEMFDKNKDGSINKEELKEVMKHFFINEGNLQSLEDESSKNKNDKKNPPSLENNNAYFHSDTLYRELIGEADIDGNEKIDFEEFVIIMQRRSKQSLKIKEDLQKAFQVFDKDGDNKISNDELTNLLTFLSNKLTEEQINEILEERDLDKDGYLNYLDFIEYVLHNKID